MVTSESTALRVISSDGKNRQTYADEIVGGQVEGAETLPPTIRPTHDENQDGKTNGADRAERLAHENLDFDPGQFPESSQHHSSHDGIYSRIE